MIALVSIMILDAPKKRGYVDHPHILMINIMMATITIGIVVARKK